MGTPLAPRGHPAEPSGGGPDAAVGAADTRVGAADAGVGAADAGVGAADAGVGAAAAGLVRLLARMPKAELHLHLDGSMTVKRALWLAETRRVEAPRTEAGMRAVLVAPAVGVDQATLLRAFDLPIELLQDAEALSLVTQDLVAAKGKDGVRYVEIRWGPLLHVRRGMSLADGIAAVCEGARRGADAAAAAGQPIVVQLISTALRSHDPAANVVLAETAARFLDQGLTGWDLAGPEAAFPDAERHRAAFEAARAGGLRITLHAGEWGGADQVRRALALEPERIAHGPGAAEDASLVAELIARGVCLDLCPTSNLQAGIVRSLVEHPLPRLARADVPVTLSTDDSTVSDLTLTEEFRRAVTVLGLTLAELWAINRRALDVAFAPQASLRPLRTAFDAWAATEPALAHP